MIIKRFAALILAFALFALHSQEGYTIQPVQESNSAQPNCAFPGPNTPQRTPTHQFVGKLASVFQIPTPYTFSGSITVGPDTNLWFAAIAGSNFGTSNPSGAIGCMTTEGSFKMFPLPTLNSYPMQITLGPDHNLWFTAEQGSGPTSMTVDTGRQFSHLQIELGMLSLKTGKITMFPLPSSSASSLKEDKSKSRSHERVNDPFARILALMGELISSCHRRPQEHDPLISF